MKLIETINNGLKDNLRFRIVLLLCSILLIIGREPALLLYSRLWAEEGVVFYAFALHHSLYEIFTTIHVGYLTLFNSIVSTIQAKLFSVENAATVSTYMGLLVQLIPIFIIIFTTHKFWDNPLKKIICMLIIIFAMAPELWLNTTNSHFIFGLITFLIMLISANQLSFIQRHLFRLLLFIGGLTGPASILFTPSFILKASREKSKEKYIQAGIITACAFIQITIIIYAILYNNHYNRLGEIDFKKTIMAFFIDNFSLGIHIQSFHLNFYFGIVVAIFYIRLCIKNKKNSEYLIALLSFIIVAVFSTLGSLHMAGSPRYAYIPTCILLIVILSEAFDVGFDWSVKKLIAPVLLCISIGANMYYYKSTMETVYSSNFPKWKDEVAIWRTDATYLPRVHPLINDWRIKL